MQLNRQVALQAQPITPFEVEPAPRGDLWRCTNDDEASAEAVLPQRDGARRLVAASLLLHDGLYLCLRLLG